MLYHELKHSEATVKFERLSRERYHRPAHVVVSQLRSGSVDFAAVLSRDHVSADGARLASVAADGLVVFVDVEFEV